MDYLGIGLESGYLKLVWSFHHDNATVEIFNAKDALSPSRLLSRLIPHSGYLADAEWHTLSLRIDMRNITVTVDQLLAYIEEPGLRFEANYDNVDLFIGELRDIFQLCDILEKVLRIDNNQN